MIINSDFYKIPSSEHSTTISPSTRLIVVTPNITALSHDLLSKILKATGLSDIEYIHINIENDTFNVKNTSNIHNSLKIIIFDCNLAQLGLQVNAKKYQTFHLHSTELVLVDDLESVGNQVQLKKYIWNLLRSWFITQKDE